MRLNDFQDATIETCIYPGAGSGNELELYYLAMGLCSEAGEVAGKIKKYLRDGVYDQGGLAYEIGDCFFYLARLCDAIGYEAEDVLTINHNKLQGRKDRGTLSGNGDTR